MADENTPQGEVPGSPTQQETDWKAEARKWETRSKENLAQAKANEEAARRLAEIEETQKTEAQRAQERLEAAEKRASELELRSMRAEIAAEKGLPVQLLSGSNEDEIRQAAEALIAYKGTAPEPGYTIPAAGQRPELALNGDGLEAALKQALGIK